MVGPGRAFLRSLLTAHEVFSELYCSSQGRSYLVASFVELWNGSVLIPPPAPSLFITSHATGSWGCAAIFQDQWFQLEWPADWVSTSIAEKELAPIVIFLGIWGSYWHGHKVCALCDNGMHSEQEIRSRPMSGEAPSCAVSVWRSTFQELKVHLWMHYTYLEMGLFY